MHHLSCLLALSLGFGRRLLSLGSGVGGLLLGHPSLMLLLKPCDGLSDKLWWRWSHVGTRPVEHFERVLRGLGGWRHATVRGEVREGSERQNSMLRYLIRQALEFDETHSEVTIGHHRSSEVIIGHHRSS
jgi:hypothetical protein